MQNLRQVFLHRIGLGCFYAPSVVFPFLAKRHRVLTRYQKCKLIWKVFRNARRAGSASSFLEQLTLVNAIISISASVEGVVAEFGSFKGMSAASLSLACKLVGRRLVCFDSYEGLPAPEEEVTHIDDGRAVPYAEGQLKGTLEEVNRNVTRFGDISVCEFVKGYFEDSLPKRHDERYCLIFEDADLPSSVATVICYTWTKLQDDCLFFSNEARDLEVVKLFYDDRFWNETFGCNAPGFVGAGLGLPLSLIGSCLGFVKKNLNHRNARQEQRDNDTLGVTASRLGYLCYYRRASVTFGAWI